MTDETMTEEEQDAEMNAASHLEGLNEELKGLQMRDTPATPRRIKEVEAEIKRWSAFKVTRLRGAAKETRA